MSYPDEPGYVKGSATSKAGAESIKPKRKTLCDKILHHIVMSPYGLTSTNVVEITDIAINCVTARLRELQLSGAIREFGTRQCPNSGRHKNIYVATGTPHKAVKKVRVKTREKKLLEQNTVMLEALEVYANEKTYIRPTIQSGWDIAPIFKDKGITAQTALNKIKEIK